MFCPELKRLLKPIYDLTRKGRPFIWGKEQQDSFEEIKHRLIRPPVLLCLTKQADFTCIQILVNLQLAAHFIKYRMENGKPKLTAYVSKRLPEAMRRYSITELELCSLAISIASFSHLLKRVDFDAIVDHLALMHIPKARWNQPPLE